MNEQKMRELLGARPFRPFDVVMSSGQRHSVRHPENALLTKSSMMITNPEVDTFVVVSLLHITSIAFFQAA
jgi:hypothetical protein